jgi:hypothetical protein
LDLRDVNWARSKQYEPNLWSPDSQVGGKPISSHYICELEIFFGKEHILILRRYQLYLASATIRMHITKNRRRRKISHATMVNFCKIAPEVQHF